MRKAVLRSFPAVFAVLMIFGGTAAGEPLTLEQCIGEALKGNPRLRSLTSELQAVDSGFWDTVLPANPSVFAEYEGVPDGKSLSEFEARKVGIAQSLENPWSYLLRKRGLGYDRNLIRAEYLAVRNEVTAEVKTGYYRVLLLRQEREVYEEIERLTRELLEKTRIRVAAGESASYDTLRVRVDLADIENILLAADRDYDAALYELKLLLGRSKDEPVDIEGELTYSPYTPDTDALKERAMESHPRLRAALASVDRRRVDRSLQVAGLFPEIEVRWFNHTLPGSPSPDAWGGAIGLSIPIWAFLKERGRIDAASNKLEAEGWRVETEKRRVLLGVENACSKLVLAGKQVEKYRESTLREVGELIRIATRSYEEGEMGYLEVTEAYRAMYRTNAGYAEALFAYLAALAELEEAVGAPIFDN